MKYNPPKQLHIPIKLSGNSIDDITNLILHYRKQILNEEHCNKEQMGWYKGCWNICDMIEFILNQNKQ